MVVKNAALVFLSGLLFFATIGECGTSVNPETGRLDLTGVDVQQTDCSTVTTEGTVCWDTDNDTLCVGDGAACASIGGSSGNSFETINVPAGTDPVADSATDTLTITETSFLTLTGTAGTDTIDITQVTTDLGTDGLIAANAVALGTDTTNAYVADLTAGTAIDVSGGGAETATVTVDWDSTEVEATTWGAGGNASNAWTFNVSGANDPVLTFDGLISPTMTLTGRFSSDGLTVGADETILLGAASIQYVTGTGDVTFSDDVTISTASPKLEWDDTGDDNWEVDASDGQWRVVNKTDGKELLRFGTAHQTFLTQIGTCTGVLSTTTAGEVGCYSLTEGSTGIDISGRAISFDATELNAVTLGDNTVGTIEITGDITPGADPVITLSAGTFGLNSGVTFNMAGFIVESSGTKLSMTGDIELVDNNKLQWTASGAQLTFASSTNDFQFNNDARFTDASPSLTLSDTTASADDLHVYIDGNQAVVSILDGTTGAGQDVLYLSDTKVVANKAFQAVSTTQFGGATYTWPSADGSSSQVLSTNGSGTLSWITPASGATYREWTLLPQGAVLDDTAPPQLTVVESTGTGTARRYVMDFDAATDEIVYWTFVVPSDMTAGNWLLGINWYTNDIGANEDAIWAAQMSCTSEGDADSMAEDAAGSANTASENCNATEANRLIQTTLTLSNTDSVAAGDTCTLRFFRDADDSVGDADNDGLSSDARLLGIRLQIPRS